MIRTRRGAIVLSMMMAASLLAASVAAAQRQTPVPRPFPRPGDRAPATPEPAPQPAPPADAGSQAVAATPARPGDEAPPTEAMLGMPVYPASQFITSYDAGLGQRYYLFGSTASFEEMVSYYATVLRQRGNRVFDAPPTHMFDVGRFREDSMAFPPGVTIKDYAWNGSEGYLNPQPGADPARFRTIIQIVPPPAGAPR